MLKSLVDSCWMTCWRSRRTLFWRRAGTTLLVPRSRCSGTSLMVRSASWYTQGYSLSSAPAGWADSAKGIEALHHLSGDGVIVGTLSNGSARLLIDLVRLFPSLAIPTALTRRPPVPPCEPQL